MGDPAMPSAWTRFWFGPASLQRLALFRILILLLAVWDFAGYSNLVLPDAAAISDGRMPRPWNPILMFELLGLEPIGAQLAGAIHLGMWAALLAGIFGLFTRTACAVVALGMIYWTGLAYSFGKPHHDKIALVFALLALPFGPVGARLSIDRLLVLRRRAARGGSAYDDPAEQQTWAGLPLRITQVTVAIGYCFAGLSKLILGGAEWMNGYTLQGIMLGHDHEWSWFFAQSRSFCQITSVVTVTAQATFPLVFLFPRLLWLYVPALTGFHLTTWMTMNTGPYMGAWFCMVAFLPLEQVPGWWRQRVRSLPSLGRWLFVAVSAAVAVGLLLLFVRRLGPWVAVALFPVWITLVLALRSPRPLHLLIDGDCRLCRRQLALIAALDWGRGLRAHDASRWTPELAQRFPELEQGHCLEEMHLVDGGVVLRGFAAWRRLLWRLPLFAPLAPFLYLPPFSGVGRWVYRAVATRRLRDGCGGEVCSLRPDGGS